MWPLNRGRGERERLITPDLVGLVDDIPGISSYVRSLIQIRLETPDGDNVLAKIQGLFHPVAQGEGLPAY